MNIDSMNLEPIFSKDPRINFILEQCKSACQIFVDAIRESTEEQIEISFKAFTLETSNKEEVDSVFEIIMTSFAVELKQIASDLVEKYTFYNSKEETLEDECSLLFHCRKEKTQ